MSDDTEARVAAGLARVRERIATACARCGRAPDSVRLLAVSKRQPEAAIRAAYAQGQREFGENYVQELVQKARALADLPDLRMHLIGRLQTNKVKDVVQAKCTVDTLDSLRLAEALQTRLAAVGGGVEVLVQVNIGEESQKAGVALGDLAALLVNVRSLSALQLRGLLVIPPLTAQPEERRPYFRSARLLAEQHGLGELSMGMSDDLEVAIEEGATTVRVGTAVFGARPSS